MAHYYSINYLSPDFYSTYDTKNYPEIENKPGRPYVVLTVRIENNTFAIPFRTTMPHKYGYQFQNTGRPTQGKSGLDFSKSVIINAPSYIGNTAIIDQAEFMELSNKFHFIVKKFETYVKNYIKVANGSITDPFILKKYKYCTLKYFHKELGIKI